MALPEIIEAHERGNYARTAALCREALGRDLSPEDRFVAHTYLGYALVKVGDQRSANEHLHQAVALAPTQHWRMHLHYVLGAGLRYIGDGEGARREFQQAIEEVEEVPDDEVREELFYSLVDLSILECERDEYSAALAYAERASQVSIRARPENQPFLLSMEAVRGEALFRLGRWRDSLAAFRRALAIVPEADAGSRGHVMAYLGLALCAVQELDEALEVLEATDLEPAKEPSVWTATRVWLGTLYYWKDKYDDALGQFEAIADRSAEELGDFRDCLARLADCYLETGKPARGLALAEKTYRELRGNALVHIVYAKALALAGRYPEADAVLRELDETALDAGLRERLYAHLAYIAVGLRERASAEKWLNKLSALNPDSRYINPLRDALKKVPKRVSGILRWFKR